VKAEEEQQRAALAGLQAGDAYADGQYSKAEYLYRRSLEWKSRPESYLGLARTLSSLGRHLEAVVECGRAIELDADSGAAYSAMAEFYLKMKNTDEAITWYEKAVRTPRFQQRFFSQFRLGLIWERRGLVDQARRCFEGALKDRPDFSRARKALARLAGKHSRF
jgi:tetratricopeptide (TPR) repeat protein